MDGVIAASEPVRRLHPAVTRFAGRIVCPDAQVEPHEDDVEIQAEAETPVCGKVAGQAGGEPASCPAPFLLPSSGREK